MTDFISLRLEASELIALNVRLMNFVHADGRNLSGFEPGAHIEFYLGEGLNRAYSLISDGVCSAAPSYKVAVLLETDGGGGSVAMHAMQIGDMVKCTSPANDFPLIDTMFPSILIAGGIGITPMISMAAELKKAQRPYQLNYANQSRDRMAFADSLKADHCDRLKLHFDDEAGSVLDLNAIMSAADNSAHIFICGPATMIDAGRAAAAQAGFSPEQIHVELFTAPDARSGDVAFDVVVNSSGERFTVPPGQTIIEVLEEAGLDIMYDCHRGDCGICQTDVLVGVPDHRDVVLSDAERSEGKVMQICVSRAKTDTLVLDL